MHEVRRPPWLVFAWLAMAPFSAHAFETEVFAETAAQGYALRSPFGEPIVSRRRFLQTLGFSLYDLQGETKPKGPRLAFRARMRLDSDFGIADDELVYDAGANRFVPGLRRADLDLMVGYLEGERLFDGHVGFRLGRQYVVDSLGWWSFDGGLVRLTTPAYFAAVLYGGFEQRGGLPLSTSRFEQNGIWRGDRRDLEPFVYPELQEAELAPAYGVAIETTGPSWLHARIDYRKVWNRGDTVVQIFPHPVTGTFVKESGIRTSQERAGGSLDVTIGDAVHMNTGVVYDFYNARFSTYHGLADWYASPRLTLSAEYERYLPTFDGDSIFNFFAHEPMQTALGHLAWEVTPRLDVAASGGVRLFDVEDSYDSDPGEAMTDFLGNVSLRHRWSRAHAGLRMLYEAGERGSRKGADLYGERRFFGERWLGSARTSLYAFDDPRRPFGSITSFAYVLGGGFRPSEETTLRLEWEHAMNRLVGQRYRVLAMVDLRVR